MRNGLALIAILVTASIAPMVARSAVPAPAPVKLLTDPVWKARPADSDLWGFYPLLATHLEIGGFAVIECTVGEQGELKRCRIDGEQPRKEGFGTALSKIASRMQVEAVSASGAPTTGRAIRIGAQFKYTPMPKDVRPPYKPWDDNSFAFRASREMSIELVTVQK